MKQEGQSTFHRMIVIDRALDWCCTVHTLTECLSQALAMANSLERSHYIKGILEIANRIVTHAIGCFTSLEAREIKSGD